MKMLMRILTAFALAMTVFTHSVSALTVNDPGVIGIVDPGIPASDADRLNYVNFLLAMPASTVQVALGQTFVTSGVNYSGLALLAGAVHNTFADPGGTLTLPAGFRVGIVKYDGPNAGSVVFALGGNALTVPQFPTGIWGAPGQFGISGWTVFNAVRPPVPTPFDVGDPEPVTDGGNTVILLGLGLIGLALIPGISDKIAM